MAQPDTTTKIVDVVGLAAELRVHPETIRRLVRAGAIPVVRVGRALRFDVARCVDALSGATTPTPAHVHAEPRFDALDTDV